MNLKWISTQCPRNINGELSKFKLCLKNWVLERIWNVNFLAVFLFVYKISYFSGINFDKVFLKFYRKFVQFVWNFSLWRFSVGVFFPSASSTSTNGWTLVPVKLNVERIRNILTKRAEIHTFGLFPTHCQ